MLYYLTILWIIGILWGMYWCGGTSKSEIKNNVTPKVVSDFNPDIRQSTSSLESLEYSDNENIRNRNLKKLKYEIKTRWPSQTSIKPTSYKSF